MDKISSYYFSRAQTFDELEDQQLIVFDSKSSLAPRIITMDEWPSFVFRAAKGVLTVEELYERTTQAFYDGNPPDGLKEMLTDIVGRLVEDGHISLSAEPVSLPIYLDRPKSEVDPNIYHQAMVEDGFIDS